MKKSAKTKKKTIDLKNINEAYDSEVKFEGIKLSIHLVAGFVFFGIAQESSNFDFSAKIFMVLLLAAPVSIYRFVKVLFRKYNFSKGKYTVEYATCIKKGPIIPEDGKNIYKNTKNAECSIVLSGKILGEKKITVPDDEYDMTKEGDTFVLLLEGSDNHIAHSFNCEICEFTEESEILLLENQKKRLEEQFKIIKFVHDSVPVSKKVFSDALGLILQAENSTDDAQKSEALKNAVEKLETITDYPGSSYLIGKCKEKMNKC